MSEHEHAPIAQSTLRVEIVCPVTLCDYFAQYMTDAVERLIDQGSESFVDCCITIFKEGILYLIEVKDSLGEKTLCEKVLAIYDYENEMPPNPQPPFEFGIMLELSGRVAHEYLTLTKILTDAYGADDLDVVTMVYCIALLRRHLLVRRAQASGQDMVTPMQYSQSELAAIWRNLSFKPEFYTVH